jgi:hypothetical protein
MKLEATLSVLLLATAIAASSAATLHHRDTISQCEAAVNCEIYDGPYGQDIRFKKGMEPGSDHYKSIFPNSTANTPRVVKRNTQTHITVGQASMNWGTTNPCDAIHHLYNVCHEGACEDGGFSTPTQDIYTTGRNSGPRSRTINMYPQGQYNGWDQRNCYVDAIVAAMSKNQKWTKHDWTIYTKEGEDSGTQWWGEQTNFIAINKFYNNALQGFMQVRSEMDTGDDNWCGKLAGAIGAFAGAVNPIAGGFFGFVGAVCGS